MTMFNQALQELTKQITQKDEECFEFQTLTNSLKQEVDSLKSSQNKTESKDESQSENQSEIEALRLKIQKIQLKIK